MTRLAIFDCDGTLVDSGHSIHTALTMSFESHGRVVPELAQSKRVVGLSLNEAMAMLAPDAAEDEHHALAATYRESFVDLRRRGAVEEPLYAGIAELLDVLEANGWLLGVATGKSDRGLHHCLIANDLYGRFVTLQTADRHPSKPHPAMALAAMAEAGAEARDCVVIGDTSWDMGMARAAGCGAIGVLWGYHDGADLKLGGAQSLAANAAEIAAIAARLVERADG